MTADREGAQRLGPLDALRGIAALVVVLVHLHWTCSSDVFALPPVVVTIIGFGSTGVILFFVISGFSLDMTMPRHERSPKPLLSYAASRFFRIAPLFYLMIALTALFNYWYAPPARIDYAKLLVNYGFLFNLVEGDQVGIVWASWTIGVEVVFYVLFPLFYRVPLWASGVATLIPYTVVAIVFHPTVFGTFAWCSFVGFMPLFVLGMATHRLYQHVRLSSAAWAPAVFLGACAFLVALSTIPGAWGNIYTRLPIGLAYATLILGALLWNPRALSNRITKFYGSLSYSIYLLHFPVLLAMRPLFRMLLGGLPPGIAYALAIPMTLAVLTPVAALAFYWWERPFDTFGGAFRSAIGRAAAVGPPIAP